MFNDITFVHGGKFTSRESWIHAQRVIDTTEIIIVTKGTVYLRVSDTDYELSAGSVLLIPAGEIHGGYKKSDDEVSFYWLHFKGALGEHFPSLYLTPENTYQAELICRQILHYEKTPGFPHEATDCLIRVLLMELYYSTLNTRSEGSRVFLSICEWIRTNSDLLLKVSDVAQRFSYNEDYVNRLFKRYSPTPLKEYIVTQKMQRIKRVLLSTDASLRDIAESNSFTDYKYFLKFFKYHEGISPSEFRELYKNQHTNNI